MSVATKREFIESIQVEEHMTIEFPVEPGFARQRERFLHAAKAAGATLACYEHPLRGPSGETLATDVAWLGAPDARRVLVAISGTHGVEGYYGSACQAAWLHELQSRKLPEGVAVMLVHLINPWGTAWVRRVNEDNVDLNRNYVDFDVPLPVNPRYETIHEIYTCRDIDGPARQHADAQLASHVRSMGWAEYQAIVGAGQYAHADGLFYGGEKTTWSNRTLRAIVERFLRPAQVAIAFDLHTGAGAFGHPMLMAIAQSRYPALTDAQRLYGPWLYTLLTQADAATSETGVVARATGYTSQAMLDALPDTHLMQLVIECGTYAEERMHEALRNDHWLHLYGDPLDARGRQISRALFESFLPADEDWRDIAWRRTRQIWERALKALPELEPAPKQG
ncbi:Succinylglutamate desuccinylase / Aspartoacylase family protein [Caballeronia hypogeia]|uniref:Succinylglutamate desuccinylase / Aspartoacylase family protein n=2 Tax=Caballeronia hypogeia TaxID=1777140 RepID=A0A158A7J6_9BURK|nr:Succinylglutamate desuccinylase / Aspartoacylase family protein [Caballeronia hypogeia]